MVSFGDRAQQGRVVEGHVDEQIGPPGDRVQDPGAPLLGDEPGGIFGLVPGLAIVHVDQGQSRLWRVAGHMALV